MIELPACARCGHVVFPAHLRCGRCGAVEWSTVRARAGTVQALTIVRRSLVAELGGDWPPRIALVATDEGPHVIARVTAAAQPGDRVALELDGGAPVAVPLGEDG